MEENTNVLTKLIPFVMSAHSNFVKKSADKVRRWDEKTPYFIHPLWCSMMILTEEKLSEEIRIIGSQVLAIHDINEDSSASIPSYVDERAIKIAKEMIFNDSSHEMQELSKKDILVKLFKLYDKVSNLMDSNWMNQRGREYYRARIKFCLSLVDEVEAEYGKLNIVVVAREIIRNINIE